MSGDEERLTELTDQDRIVAANLILLELDLVRETPYDKLDDETNDAKEGIVHGKVYPAYEGMPQNEEFLELSIRYETRTGRITPVRSEDQFRPGEYSMLATVGRRMRGQGVNMVVLTEFGDGTEIRAVLPQRIDPKYQDLWEVCRKKC